MDVTPFRSADRHTLAAYMAAVAANGRELLSDAELLLEHGRHARAYSLAYLAAEEWAKAQMVFTLALMPGDVRAQMRNDDLRTMLAAHELKAMGAALMRMLEAARPGVAGRLAAIPDLVSVLTAALAQARNTNAAKERGLYTDLRADGSLSGPSDVSEAEATDAVAYAREVGDQAALLHDPDTLAALADPPAEVLQVSDAVFRMWAGQSNDPASATATLMGIAAQLAPAEVSGS